MDLEYKRLDTGFHYVRHRNMHHLFAQWPIGTICTVDDVSTIPFAVSCADFAEQDQRLADSQASGSGEPYPPHDELNFKTCRCYDCVNDAGVKS